MKVDENSLTFLDKKTLRKIENAIRKSFHYYSPEYKISINRVMTRTGKRGGCQYECECCHIKYPVNKIEVDHIIPVVPLNSTLANLTLNELYNRCFTSANNLKVLCKICHRLKTKDENKIRRENKKNTNPITKKAA